MVRVVPLPPRTRLPLGISAALLELAATISEPGAVSGSEMVNVSGPVVPSSAIAWSAIVLIAGGSLTSSTEIVKVAVLKLASLEVARTTMPWLAAVS